MLKVLVISIFIVIAGLIYYYNQKPTVSINSNNVKAIWCTYRDKEGEHNLQVDDCDKEIILSEINKMKKGRYEGEIGTIGYTFIIKLVDGKEFNLYENTSTTVTIRRDTFFINIKAPKTAEFINKFLTKNNIER